MTVLALDWNATRVRAVLGRAGEDPLPVPLEPPSIELALAIALDQSVPTLGSAALRRCRTNAHQVCESFLPYLTEKAGQGPRWEAGRHVLDSHAACELVWRRLQALAVNAQGIVLTVPDYLRPVQAEALRKLGARLRLPVLGSAPVALTAAVAARLPSPSVSGVGAGGHLGPFWQRSVLVIDVDEHALTLGWVKALADKAHLIESRSFPHLGLHFWKERLIDSLSDLFVRKHRRDPRDAPLAEQSLYNQLDVLTDAALENRSLQLGVQGREWFKHLLLHPDQTVHFCQPLVAKVVGEAELLFRSWPSAEWPPHILLTHAAGRLPGLVDALRSLAFIHPAGETRLPQMKAAEFGEFDFAENLSIHDDEPTIDVRVLRPEAPARSAHGLAPAFHTGALPAGHLESIVPLPQPAVINGRLSVASPP